MANLVFACSRMGRMETTAKRKARETAETVEGEERAKAV
jgi:hypothetical protein